MNNKATKQLIINCEELETRVALLNKGLLQEYQLERHDDRNIAGSIFLGRIENLEPSLQAAFVDIGLGKNAFLHYWDMLPASYDMAEKISKEEQPQTPKKRGGFAEKIRRLLGKNDPDKKLKEFKQRHRSLNGPITVKDIPDLFPRGSEVLVQVTKGPIGGKGPRITTNLTIPGRYLVLLPYATHLGLSKKIEDRKERSRLRKVLTELDLPDDMGLICRTIAEGRKQIYFKRDLDMLLNHWHQVEVKLRELRKPGVVYQEPNLLERTIRDFLTEDIDEVILDKPDSYEYLHGVLKDIAGPAAAKKIIQHRKASPIFNFYHVEKQISRIFEREVKLPSGGYICVDETEALIAIDVNTGSSRKGKDQAKTILNTNMEACEEIARQLRLRNVGGLVVLDLIDMRSRNDRETVFRHMKKLVRNDRAKTSIIPISKFGLMEMTRKREFESLRETVFDSCPYCNGRGKVKSAVSMSVEIQRRLKEVLKRHSREKGLAVRVIMHPSILARLKNKDAGLLNDMEKDYGQRLSFRADPSIHLEEFKLVDPETDVEFQ